MEGIRFIDMISIIFGHYSEDKERDEIAKISLLTAFAQKEEGIELIIVFNGIYPYREEFALYADQWHERKADKFPGRTVNIGVSLARGDTVFMMANDTFLYAGAVKECARIVSENPKHCATPIYPRARRKQLLNMPFGEYMTNERAGDLAVCMTKKQIEDIGPHDEVAPLTDEINYINRRIAKGYTVILTKEPMGHDMAPGRHSFKSQEKGWRGYKRTRPIYSKEELVRRSYR